MWAAVQQGCLLSVRASVLRYGFAVFITLVKRLFQGFDILGAYNTLIKYAGAGNQHVEFKSQRELAGR